MIAMIGATAPAAKASGRDDRLARPGLHLQPGPHLPAQTGPRCLLPPRQRQHHQHVEVGLPCCGRAQRGRQPGLRHAGPEHRQYLRAEPGRVGPRRAGAATSTAGRAGYCGWRGERPGDQAQAVRFEDAGQQPAAGE